MEYISKNHTVRKNVSKDIFVEEYGLNSDDVSIAYASISGRYPLEGMVKNKECVQIYYVLSGCGVVHFDDKDVSLRKQGVCFFDKEQNYWVEGDALQLLIVNSPAWKSEQAIYRR